MTIPFHCPSCGDQTQAKLIHDVVLATPSEPTIRCPCGAEWRINLYQTNEDAEATGPQKSKDGA